MIWVYPGWFGENSVYLAYRLLAVDHKYYYDIDATLMYVSKGGLTARDLGWKTVTNADKEIFVKSFTELYKAVNSDSSSSDVDLGQGTPVLNDS